MLTYNGRRFRGSYSYIVLNVIRKTKVDTSYETVKRLTKYGQVATCPYINFFKRAYIDYQKRKNYAIKNPADGGVNEVINHFFIFLPTVIFCGLAVSAILAVMVKTPLSTSAVRDFGSTALGSVVV